MSTKAAVKALPEYISVPIAELVESTTNPRKVFDEHQLEELAESIRSKGILSPLLVRRENGHFEIVTGARRYRAAQHAGLREVPVRVVTLTDEEALETQIVENLLRADIHPFEEAKGFRTLLDRDGATYTIEKASGLRKDQAIYYGHVKVREINHDADLYKVYQEAAEEIRERGGKPVRVRLDFELKAAIQRERNALKDRAENERRERLETFAKEQGLTISETVIRVPDVQVEYETRDGELERTNLELISENYRTEGIRSKAESGFTIYARTGDATRVRRALHDTHTLERILSI